MVEVILVALVVSVFAPLVLGIFTARHQRMSKKQDWDRQDELDARAERRAEALTAKTVALAESTQAIEAKVDEVAVAAVAAHSETNDQLVVIHDLVNSDMTTARQELLDQMKITLALLKKIASDNEEAGTETSASDKKTIAETEARIVTQEDIIAERLAQQQEGER